MTKLQIIDRLEGIHKNAIKNKRSAMRLANRQEKAGEVVGWEGGIAATACWYERLIKDLIVEAKQ